MPETPEEQSWVTLLTTNDFARAATVNGMLGQHGIEVRFFQVPPYEIQVPESQVETAKELLEDWGME